MEWKSYAEQGSQLEVRKVNGHIDEGDDEGLEEGDALVAHDEVDEAGIGHGRHHRHTYTEQAHRLQGHLLLAAVAQHQTPLREGPRRVEDEAGQDVEEVIVDLHCHYRLTSLNANNVT